MGRGVICEGDRVRNRWRSSVCGEHAFECRLRVCLHHNPVTVPVPLNKKTKGGRPGPLTRNNKPLCAARAWHKLLSSHGHKLGPCSYWLPLAFARRLSPRKISKTRYGAKPVIQVFEMWPPPAPRIISHSRRPRRPLLYNPKTRIQRTLRP